MKTTERRIAVLRGCVANVGRCSVLGKVQIEQLRLLPANASLSVEVGWVQANRLRVVEEQSGGATSVHLGQALSPAPSWAAFGWLETSIRSYAKYVDVAAKATAIADGEADVVRRERMAIEEVKRLLDEMIEDGGGRDR